MDREEFEFKYFFNAGIDRVTGECDVEGTDVYQDGHYIGSVKWKTPEELEDMSDKELEEELLWSGIIF
jgi:hypothetical protein